MFNIDDSIPIIVFKDDDKDYDNDYENNLYIE